MKRDYATGSESNIEFFVGDEVEHTPAFGMRTLFVTGLQSVDEITSILLDTNCTHIFFGANHSFKPEPDDYHTWKHWEEMIEYFLDQGYLCSLDIPLLAVEQFNDGPLNDYDNFIPQIRVPIPYIKLWNYNTMIKIDDKDFKATNPGVWTWSLHDLKRRTKFTPWSAYKNDEIVK